MPTTTSHAHDGASSSVASTSASNNTDPKPTPRAGFFGDARILGGFNPDDTIYKRELIFTFGAKKESQSWKPAKGTLLDVLKLLTIHKEGPKHGPAFICADMAPGPRNKNAVKQITAIGLDVDVGKAFAPIRDRLIVSPQKSGKVRANRSPKKAARWDHGGSTPKIGF